MAWYEDWFGSDAYTLVYDHRDETEAERLVDLIERAIQPRPDAHILDVGCGRGRHARILARRGYQVTGLDLSPEAIEEARTRTEREGLTEHLSFHVGDMREADRVCSGVDGVVNLFTSFGYFEDDDENERALQAMRSALKPGGWLLQDFLNAFLVADTLQPSDTYTRNGATIHQRRWIDDGRINKEITIERGDSTETYRESVRLYTLPDLKVLYERVGLDLVETYGNYEGDPYTPGSPRLLLYARTSAS